MTLLRNVMLGDWTVIGKAIHIQSSLLQKWCDKSVIETIREHPGSE